MKVGDLICHHYYSNSDWQANCWKWHHHRVQQVTPQYIFVISECFCSLYNEPFAENQDGARIKLRTLRLERKTLEAKRM